MTVKAGKVWGQTELVHANGVLEFHRIEFKAGFNVLNMSTNISSMDSLLNQVK